MGDKDAIIMDEETESLFEESIINSAFSGRNDSSTESSFSSYPSDYEEDYDEDEDDENLDDYEPGDLLNLRGLFDEDAVDQRNMGSSLDFEEIPDDIDIDEPIEVEKLSRAGRIMNVVVVATLIIFSLLIVGFIINAGLVVGVVLSANYQSSLFVNITGLDSNEATINATIKTEVINMGNFIRGELDMKKEPIKAHVYLTNEGIPRHEDAILEIEYQNKALRFNGGLENVYHLEGIKMRLNPEFDSSRLSGFIEPQIEGKLHARYPRKVLVHYSMSLSIFSFGLPIFYKVKMFTELPMDQVDLILEKMKAAKMKEFDFNPRFVELMPLKNDELKLHVRQPIPKFYGPPHYEISVQIPKLEFDVRQFTQKHPELVPEIESLRVNSKHLTRISIAPFRLMMGEDSNANILDITATLNKNSVDGLDGVLSAIRDGNLGTLAFLMISSDFTSLHRDPSSADENEEDDDYSDGQTFEPQQLPGCTLAEFMKSFWGRQAYPVPLDENGPPLPSVPELYNFAKDPALLVKFNGLSVRGARNAMAFRLFANTHYVITQYKLPLLMLSGKIPRLEFKALVKHGKQSEVASFSIEHVNDPSAVSHPLGKQIVFDVFVDFRDDLGILSQFILKLSRLQTLTARNIPSETIKGLVGEMFNNIEGIEISADSQTGGWISTVASAFDLKLNTTNDGKFDFIYSKSGLPVISDSKHKVVETTKTPSQIEEEHERITKALNQLLNVDATKISGDDDLEAAWFKQIEATKKTVKEADLAEYKMSVTKSDLSVEAKKLCEEARESMKSKEKAGKTTESSSESTIMEPHKKLLKVRELLIERNALKRAAPFSYGVFENGLVGNLTSEQNHMNFNLAVVLHQLERSFEDHLRIEWQRFRFDIDDVKGTNLVSFKFDPGHFDMSLSDFRVYSTSFKRKPNPISLNVELGPKDEEMSVSTWMKSFRAFYAAAMDVSEFFLPFKFGFAVEGDLEITYKSVLPTSRIPSLSSENCGKIDGKSAASAGFFDNLTRSHFDFIGYGFYQMIFHAILPNPESCPLGSVIYNVELNLPASRAFIFGKAGTAELTEAGCVATVSTAHPLRIWTQIVDGVLCNMYAVADGLAGQKEMFQAKISRERASTIIQSFERVLKIREVPETYSIYEPFKHLRTPMNPDVDLERVPLDKRIGLVTAVPVTIEILDFERMIKLVDAMGEKKLVQLFSDDPLRQSNSSSSSPIDSRRSLFDNLLSALGSKFPIEFNPVGDLQVSPAVAKRILVFDDPIILDIDTASSSPNDLTVSTRIYMPERLGKEGKEGGNGPYVLYQSLVPEKRFQYPVVRWGETLLRFAFPKFTVELKLSAGDLKITNDGQRVLFDSLVDFRIDLSIAGVDGGAGRDFFQVTSIRQFFKRCQDFVRKTLIYDPKETQMIRTTSVVDYGDKCKFHRYGQADMESFFSLQGVIIRKMFSSNASDEGSSDEDEFSDPRDDPTFMDFSLLISLGEDRLKAGEDAAAQISRLPHLKLPCFFTNFCSAEQLSYSAFNRRDLLVEGEHIPVKLHVRDTFKPLAASIAAGFATLLPIFHMETYPKRLEWHLKIPADQVVGMDMNGEGMFFGKTEGPLIIVKDAEIPYPNALMISKNKSKQSKSESKQSKNKLSKSQQSKQSEHNKSTQKRDKHKSKQSESDESASGRFVEYSNRAAFERDFYSHQLDGDDFGDEVIIPLMVQVPETLPHVLRKMLWPMFFIPLSTISLHPPLLNVESGKEVVELTHAPISVALSDGFVYRLPGGGGSVRPSLLARLFAAFMEESSGSGLDAHSVKPPTVEPSPFRMHYSLDRNMDTRQTLSIANARELFSMASSYIRSDVPDLVHLVLWVQFPWAMGPIGFDFGSMVQGKVFLDDSQVFVEGAMTQHHMIGNVGRIRVDFMAPLAAVPKILYIATTFGLKYANSALLGSLSGSFGLQDIPLRCEFVVGGNFVAETELVIPKALAIQQSQNSGTFVGHVALHHTRKNVDSIIQAYKGAPEAIACIYNRSIHDSEFEKQSKAWSQLDLSLTRLYYGNITGIKPGDALQLFLQLRTAQQKAVCGLLDGVLGIAVKIQYIPPSKPFKLIFNHQSPDLKPQYFDAKFDPITSIFLVENVNLPITGRYSVSIALRRDKNSAKLSKLPFKELKFTEIYVQNSR